MATMKRLARQGLEGSSQVGLQLEEDLASAALLDDDVSEGLAAFEARRTPVFKA
jgi:enoyl-CoA hydratase